MNLTSGRLTLVLPPGPSTDRLALHVEREARVRYSFPADAFTVGGRLLDVDFGVAERIAATMNAARASGDAAGPAVAPGELGAAALLHELAHALLATYDWREAALSAVVAGLGQRATSHLLGAARERFPPPSLPPEGRRPAAAAATGGGAKVDDQTTIEELLLLGEARDNRALDTFAELFELAGLATGGALETALGNVHRVLRGVPVGAGRGALAGAASVVDAPGPEVRGRRAEASSAERVTGGGDLLSLLRAPTARHPGSLLGQLEAALELWAPLIGQRFALLLRRALRGLDRLREERTFVAGPGHAGPAPSHVKGRGAAHPSEAAYSSDRAWMPSVVMVAKNAFVWLEQLSRRWGRAIERLDQVPDEALRELAGQGFDTLWLVGVWQRSEASRTIKRLRGQPFAEASAYAIHDYLIAPELGGEGALDELAGRAARYGLRLASDMVPNHTGIDARWVEERPDWFLRLAAPPFSSYRFSGPDLTPGRAIAVRIEDGYYDGSDAAVVFERRERATGEASYLYHGNDGTAMPWNDTAQLDYLNPEVRAAVIDTVVAVAQRFKVIRFDAAMTLVKRHVRRLWHPPPGEGGAIPSRSRHALEAEEFERAMPREFWREVVEAVARRAPDTLLVAEAFWLLESYFVRTLGVHRVYNSAFMHFLAAERNAEHRRLLRTTLANDPRDLERFVNYLTTPDEDTAAEAFGSGDKYFGAATMLATLPGLPLFGHGQVEGLREKYGMEFRAPRHDEPPDARSMARHQQVIAPLLARRGEFASALDFHLVDLMGEDGSVVEDVYAYLFARSPARERAAIVLFNNSPRSHAGRLVAVPSASGRGPTFDLASALGFGGHGVNDWLTARIHLSGGGRPSVTGARDEAGVSWEVDRLRAEGLRLTLEPYQAVVFLDIAYQLDTRSSAAGRPALVTAVGARRRAAEWTPAMLARPRRDAGRRRAAARRRR